MIVAGSPGEPQRLAIAAQAPASDADAAFADTLRTLLRRADGGAPMPSPEDGAALLNEDGLFRASTPSIAAVAPPAPMPSPVVVLATNVATVLAAGVTSASISQPVGRSDAAPAASLPPTRPAALATMPSAPALVASRAGPPSIPLLVAPHAPLRGTATTPSRVAATEPPPPPAAPPRLAVAMAAGEHGVTVSVRGAGASEDEAEALHVAVAGLLARHGLRLAGLRVNAAARTGRGG